MDSGFYANLGPLQDIGGQVQGMVNQLRELWPRVQRDLSNYLDDFSGQAKLAYQEVELAVGQLLASSTDEFGGHSAFLTHAAETYHTGDVAAAKMFYPG